MISVALPAIAFARATIIHMHVHTYPTIYASAGPDASHSNSTIFPRREASDRGKEDLSKVIILSCAAATSGLNGIVWLIVISTISKQPLV